MISVHAQSKLGAQSWLKRLYGVVAPAGSHSLVPMSCHRHVILCQQGGNELAMLVGILQPEESSGACSGSSVWTAIAIVL